MQLSDKCWSCICCKNKGIGSKRWRNSKLTVFLRGTVSSGLFQHGHVTSNNKLETPAAGSTDSTYTRNKLRLSTDRQCHYTSSLWALCLSRPSTATGCIQLLVRTFKLAIIPKIRFFCGTFQDTKLQILRTASPETTVYFPCLWFSQCYRTRD